MNPWTLENILGVDNLLKSFFNVATDLAAGIYRTAAITPAGFVDPKLRPDIPIHVVYVPEKQEVK